MLACMGSRVHAIEEPHTRSDMAVFITGGHGHIASWTALYLARQGRDVIVYDLREERPECLQEVAHRIKFIQGDVLDFATFRNAVRRHREGLEGILHTVGVMGEFVTANPHDNVRLNVIGLVNALELARAFEIAKVVYTSTGAVYGPVTGIAEESLPPNPADLYAATKVSAELLGIQYGQSFGFDFRVARLFFVYGPGRYPSGFIRLYQAAFGVLEGIVGIRMEKGADQKLDFSYVEDAARGLALLFEANSPEHQVFNIASGEAHSVGEVVALARKYTHFPVEVEIGPGELMRRCQALDIGRAERELGFRPQVSLEDGIRRYADWLRDHSARS